MFQELIMSDYAFKLSSISMKKQKLLEEENQLIIKRKKEIGYFAEKFGLLTLSDALIAGLFSEAQAAIESKSEKIKLWEKSGASFLKPKRNSKAVETCPV